MKGSVASVVVLAFSALAAAFPPALAHVPEVGSPSHVIAEPLRSWAFYEELPTGQRHNWTFHLARGDPLFLNIGVPTGAAWVPLAELRGPGGVIVLQRVDAVTLEPFSPYASREVWSLHRTAPENGTYSLTIAGAGGRYVLGYGLAERFSATQWVTIPVALVGVRVWQGNTLWITAGLYAAAVAGPLMLRRPLTGPATLGRLAAALFLASGVDRLVQLAVAALQGAQAAPGAWFLGAALALPSLALGATTWRASRPSTLAVAAALGLVAWAGLLVGSVLALAASVAEFTSRLRRTG